MSTMIQAIPTEYDHVVFRSKSEAIFARGLTLSEMLWEYEPKQWKHESGWVPDFKIAVRGYTHHPTTPKVFFWCLEFKPSMPTDTYLVNLGIRLDSMSNKLNGVDGILVVGNPFDTETPRIVLLRCHGWLDITDNFGRWIFGFWDEAMKYRFDLKQ